MLVLKIPASGEYRLFVANLSFRGGPEFVYRLTLSNLPYVNIAFPPAVLAGHPTEVELFFAHGSADLLPRRETLNAGPLAGETWLSPPGAANRVALVATDQPSLVEREPNDSAPRAIEIVPGAIVCGQLATAGDEDWFRVAAKAGQLVAIDCRPFPKSSPALPVTSVVDATGATLVSVKSAEAPDRTCRLDWRAPADGTFFVRVADARQGAVGGNEFVYLLSLNEGRPDFSLAAKADFVNVVQAGRIELELSVTRRGGFEGPIDLAIEGLPEGVTFEPKQIAANQPTAKIAFVAAEDARPTAASLRITGTATLDGKTLSRVVQANHLGHDADGVTLGPATIANLQLTVAHKPVFKLYCSEAYQYAHRGTVYPYLMEVERLDGFAGPIHLEVADRQIKDLDGIVVREMTVEPGRTTFKLPLFLPETMHINIQAHSNVYAQGYVSFVDKWGQPQSHLVVSTMRCMVRTLPPVAKLQAVDRQLSAKPGSTVACRLELIRTSNFSGPMQIELVNSPVTSGISADRITLAPGETAATIAVRVGAETVPHGEHSLIFRATGTMPGDVQVISEAEVRLKFE